MDEVLTRPLFRDVYLQTVKKKTDDGILSVYKFQKGGEVFTEAEKQAILASPFIESLAGATIGPGETKATSLIKALGKGAGNLGSQILNIKKLELAGRKEGKERIIEKELTQQELIDKKLPLDTLATQKFALTQSGLIPLGGFDIKQKSQVKDLGDDVDKSKLAIFDSALSQTEDLFSKQYNAGLGLPGMGVGGSLAVPFSKQARINQDTFQGTLNKLIKLDAGTSQSLQEAQRLAKEFSQSSFRTEEEVVRAIQRMREKVEDEKKSIFAKYTNEDTVKEYIKRGGLGFKESPFKTPGSTQKEKINLEPGLPTFTIEKGVLKRK